jgi:hypothetical protein
MHCILLFQPNNSSSFSSFLQTTDGWLTRRSFCFGAIAILHNSKFIRFARDGMSHSDIGDVEGAIY